MEISTPFILLRQYLGYRWPGDAKSQGINTHDIDRVSLEFPSFITKRVNILGAIINFCIFQYCFQFSTSPHYDVKAFW